MLAVYTSPFKAKAGDTQIWGPCTSDHTPPSAPPAFGILSYTISKMQQRLWFHQYSVHGKDPNVHQKDTTPQQGLKGKAEKLRPAKEAKEKELVLLGWIKLGKLDKNPYPQDPCMVYLPTFTKSIMYVNITCRDPIWYDSWQGNTLKQLVFVGPLEVYHLSPVFQGLCKRSWPRQQMPVAIPWNVRVWMCAKKNYTTWWLNGSIYPVSFDWEHWLCLREEQPSSLGRRHFDDCQSGGHASSKSCI